MPDPAVRRLVAQAEEQGFPRQVEDPIALRRVATLLRASERGNGAQPGATTNTNVDSAGLASSASRSLEGRGRVPQ